MMIGKRIGIVRDIAFFDHRIEPPSKECPERVRRLYLDIEQDPELGKFTCYSPRLVSDEAIYRVHSEHYLRQVLEHSVNPDPYSYDPDTYITPDSPHVAKLSAGAGLVLADALMGEEIDGGFALIRPPGHHAETGRGAGFCIFNNVAITAQHLIDHYNINRILIVDFDTHHGNGTQDIFYQTDKVLTLSIHQNNLFPFTGCGDEIGQGVGSGYNINIPVPPQFGDAEYSCIFGTVVQNVVENYLPQVILVSAGYDAHTDDPISQTDITTEGYRAMTYALKYFSERIDAKLLYILEGGYNPESLSASVRASLSALSDSSAKCPSFRHAPRAIQAIEKSWSVELIRKWAPASIGA